MELYEKLNSERKYNNEIIFIDENEKGYIVLITFESYQSSVETYGYEISEKLTLEIYNKIKSNIPENAVIYKFFLDFVIKFSGSNEDDIYTWVYNFQKIMMEKINVNKIEIPVSLCFGAVAYPRDGKDIGELLENAHINCKINSNFCNESINQVCNKKFSVFDINDKELYRKRTELYKKLTLSVSNNFKGFELFYQPQICAKTAKCISAEALLRWRDDAGEIIMPNILIPCLEALNLMSEVSSWVISQAIKQCGEWIKQGIPKTFSISVNLTSKQIVKGLTEQILEVIEENNLSPNCLTIELTETVFMDEIQTGMDVLRQLRGYGISVSIDDFGTGYSSLSYLSTLPIDEIKIDSSFIWNMERDDASKQVIEAVTNIAHSLGLIVCAEGVETKSQLKMLIDLGVDLFQGYLYSKPISAGDFEELYILKDY